MSRREESAVLDRRIADVIEAFEEQSDIARDIFSRKVVSRGTDNITEQGVPGVFIRMKHDKMARLQKMLPGVMSAMSDENFNLPAFLEREFIEVEDVIDDCLDISNYALMLVLLIKGDWS